MKSVSFKEWYFVWSLRSLILQRIPLLFDFIYHLLGSLGGFKVVIITSLSKGRSGFLFICLRMEREDITKDQGITKGLENQNSLLFEKDALP